VQVFKAFIALCEFDSCIYKVVLQSSTTSHSFYLPPYGGVTKSNCIIFYIARLYDAPFIDNRSLF
jgi:hypothetical protein